MSSKLLFKGIFRKFTFQEIDKPSSGLKLTYITIIGKFFTKILNKFDKHHQAPASVYFFEQKWRIVSVDEIKYLIFVFPNDLLISLYKLIHCCI